METGKAPETLALEALDDKLSSEFTDQPKLLREEWLRQFHAWVDSHKSRNLNADDSRESIYQDR